MNVLIASLMLLSAIQADGAQMSYELSAIQADAAQLSYKRVGDGDTVMQPVGDGDGVASSGAGALDLNDAMQTLADEKADARERQQRIIEDHLHDVEQKRYVVAAKLKGIDQIVQSDENRHSLLKTKGLLTDDRNAKRYLHDADVVVQGKIELKIEKRARFAAEVIQQQHLITRNEALVVKKQEQTQVVDAKILEQQKERQGLLELLNKEANLSAGVNQSQTSRLNDINEKLGLDQRGIDGLTGTLQTERAQETALTSQLAKIVHNGDEVTKIRATLDSKTEQLALKNSELVSAQASAAQAKIDCGQSGFLQKKTRSSESEEQISKKKIRDQVANIPKSVTG